MHQVRYGFSLVLIAPQPAAHQDGFARSALRAVYRRSSAATIAPVPIKALALGKLPVDLLTPASHSDGLLDALMVCGEGLSLSAVEQPVRAVEFLAAEHARWFWQQC